MIVQVKTRTLYKQVSINVNIGRSRPHNCGKEILGKIQYADAPYYSIEPNACKSFCQSPFFFSNSPFYELVELISKLSLVRQLPQQRDGAYHALQQGQRERVAVERVRGTDVGKPLPDLFAAAVLNVEGQAECVEVGKLAQDLEAVFLTDFVELWVERPVAGRRQVFQNQYVT